MGSLALLIDGVLALLVEADEPLLTPEACNKLNRSVRLEPYPLPRLPLTSCATNLTYCYHKINNIKYLTYLFQVKLLSI